jgi:hypothetical protein
MSDNILAIIPVYNDLAGATRLYQILSDNNIYSIWGDGKFPLYEDNNKSSLSNDGTREYLQDAQKTLLLDMPDFTLPAKLTSMLHMAGEMGYRYAILFGADEYPEGDFDALERTLDNLHTKEPTVHCLPFETDDKNVYSLDHVERVFELPSRISVKKVHYMFFKDDETKAMRCSPITYNEVKIIHDHTIRPQERDDKMTAYQIHEKGQEKAELQAEMLGITTEVTYDNLKVIYPQFEIDEEITPQGKTVFYIRDKKGFRVDSSKLIHNWKRQRQPGGLVVVS